MDYSLFYDRKKYNDVLHIVLDCEKFSSSFIKENNLTKWFAENKLIEIEIENFSQIAKIHANGLIPLPINKLIDVINSVLIAHNIEKLDYKTHSGFFVGCIKNIDKDVIFVNIGSENVYCFSESNNLELNDKIVVAIENTVLFNKTKVKHLQLRNYEISGKICTFEDLNLDVNLNKNDALILQDDADIGSDFFQVKM